MAMRDILADDIANVLLNSDDFAEGEATYQPEGGAAISGITVLVQRDPLGMDISSDGHAEVRHARILVHADDVGTPQRDAKVTLTDPIAESWQVVGYQAVQDAAWWLDCVEVTERYTHGDGAVRGGR